jgi:hypothetical protein
MNKNLILLFILTNLNSSDINDKFCSNWYIKPIKLPTGKYETCSAWLKKELKERYDLGYKFVKNFCDYYKPAIDQDLLGTSAGIKDLCRNIQNIRAWREDYNPKCNRLTNSVYRKLIRCIGDEEALNAADDTEYDD